MAVQIHSYAVMPAHLEAVIGWGWPFRYTQPERDGFIRAAVIGWGWPFRYTLPAAGDTDRRL